MCMRLHGDEYRQEGTIFILQQLAIVGEPVRQVKLIHFIRLVGKLWLIISDVPCQGSSYFTGQGRCHSKSRPLEGSHPKLQSSMHYTRLAMM
jgi:hypothetical protein